MSEPKAVIGEKMPPSDTPKSHPAGFWFFFWGEFAERSSYYGMRTILPLYLTTVLLYDEGTGGSIYYVFKMACYFLPLVGGYLADRYFGRYWTIVGFSVPYVLGHFILGIPEKMWMFVALSLLAMGSGVIKPNISTLMGQTYDQKRPGQESLRAAAFMWFYFAINVGALISTFALPWVRNDYMLKHLTPEVRTQVEKLTAKGEDIAKIDLVPTTVRAAAYARAFMFPTILMALSLAVFALGKKYYAKETTGQRAAATPDERQSQWDTLGRLFGIFALIIIFWVAYEQMDVQWVFFISDYVNLRLPFTDWTMSSDQLQLTNPLFVIILIPIFNAVFHFLDPKVQIFTAMRKILAGFLFTAGAAAIMAVLGFIVQSRVVHGPSGLTMPSEDRVSCIWIILAYIIATVGEVLLYGTALELSYAAAPKSMKGFVTACFLVTNTLGNLINTGFTHLYGGELKKGGPVGPQLLPGQFFSLTTALVIAASVAFVFVGRRFDAGRISPETTEGLPQ